MRFSQCFYSASRSLIIRPVDEFGSATPHRPLNLPPVKVKINDDNDGVSATIGRSPAICLARIRCRIDAVWRSDQSLFELRLYGRTYRTLRPLSQ